MPDKLKTHLTSKGNITTDWLGTIRFVVQISDLEKRRTFWKQCVDLGFSSHHSMEDIEEFDWFTVFATKDIAPHVLCRRVMPTWVTRTIWEGEIPPSGQIHMQVSYECIMGKLEKIRQRKLVEGVN